MLGFSGTPDAGDRLAVVENEARAREVTDYRARQKREKTAARATGMRGSLEQMMAQAKTAGRKEFPLVIKADVQGSLEAIIGALDKLGTDEVARARAARRRRRHLRVRRDAGGSLGRPDHRLQRARQFRCPRCGKPFFADSKWWGYNTFVRRCLHCKLALHAPIVNE